MLQILMTNLKNRTARDAYDFFSAFALIYISIAPQAILI